MPQWTKEGDVRPYVRKANGEVEKRRMFQAYMKMRKEDGHRLTQSAVGRDGTAMSERHTGRR